MRLVQEGSASALRQFPFRLTSVSILR